MHSIVFHANCFIAWAQLMSSLLFAFFFELNPILIGNHCVAPPTQKYCVFFFRNHVFLATTKNKKTKKTWKYRNRCSSFIVHSPTRRKNSQSFFSRHFSWFLSFYGFSMNLKQRRKLLEVKTNFCSMLLYIFASFLWSQEKVSWHSISMVSTSIEHIVL